MAKHFVSFSGIVSSILTNAMISDDKPLLTKVPGSLASFQTMAFPVLLCKN